MSTLDDFKKQIAEVKDPEERTELFLQLARAYRSNHEFDDALECFQEAERNAATDNHRYACKYECAQLLMTESKSNRALPILLEILAAAEQGASSLGVEQLNNQIGICYKDMSDYDNALVYYNRSYELFKESGDIEGVTGALINIANVYKTFGKFDSALDRFNEVLDLINDHQGYDEHLALIYSSLGSIYRQKKNFEKAKFNYERSLVIKKRLGDQYGVCHNLNSLALTYKDQRKFDKAMHTYQNCLALEREHKLNSLIAITLSNIGQLYVLMGDLDEAEKHLDEGLAIARELDANRVVMQNYLLHAQLYGEKKDVDNTIKFFMLYDQAKSRLLNEKAMERMHELEVKLELQRKEHEAEIYRLRNEELETKNRQLEVANRKLTAAQEEIRALERRNSVYAMAVTANHEMNQPLMIIQGNLDMLECEIDKNCGNADRHLQRIRQSLERLNTLLTRFRESEDIRLGEYSEDTPMVLFENEKSKQ